MAFQTNRIQIDGSLNVDGSIFQFGVPFSGASEISWGSITGNLYDQTDVSIAIDSKVRVTLFDSSIASLDNKNIDQDASIVNLRSKDTNIDTSLNDIWVSQDTQDSSIVLRPTFTYVDGSLNAKVNTTLFDSSIASLTSNKLDNTTDTFAGILSVTGSIQVDGSIVTSDHSSTGSQAEVVNVCYGTGSPPTANTTPIGTIYIQYTP